MPDKPDGLNTEALPFPLIEESLRRRPALLLPLGGLEPLGPHVAIGAHNRIGERITDALAQRTHIMHLPLLTYGYTTPYRAFGGCGGIKPQILASLVYSILCDYIAQGTRFVCLVDGSYDNYEPLLGAVKRVNQRGRANVVIFSWQREPGIRSFIAQRGGVSEPGRSEFGLLSLAAYCAPEMVERGGRETEVDRRQNESYLTWRRRGRDPEKYRKLFSDSLVGEGKYDASFGKALFDHIVSEGTKIILQTAAEQEISFT